MMVYTTLSNPTKTDPISEHLHSPVVMETIPETNYDDDDDKSDDERESDYSQEDVRQDIRRHSSDSDSVHSYENYRKEAKPSEPDNSIEYQELPVFVSAQGIPDATQVSGIEKENEMLEKQSLLLDLQRLKMQGIKLSKEWSTEDRVEDLTLEIRRHTLHLDEVSNVQTMRDGLRLVCTGFEMMNNKFGLLDLEGWSSEVCNDLNKHDQNLSRIYRKYWRRGQSSNPELDIAASLFASMGMYHFKRKMSKKILNPGSRPSQVKPTPKVYDDSDDDEEAPP
tara:strand:+ start:1121 stop:1960 length:840 start_codon:yes stop_codon:yes gene_type:complete